MMKSKNDGLWLAPALGACAGCAAFLLDLALARWMLGFPLVLHGYFVGWYAAVGVAAGCGMAAWRWWRRRGAAEPPNLRMLFATCFYAMWLPGVAERLQQAFARQDLPRSLAVIAGAAVGYLLAGWACRLFAGWPGLVLGAASWSAALAIHRNVLDDDFSLRAATIDGLVVVAAIALAAAARLAGGEAEGRRGGVAAGVCGVAGLVLLGLVAVQVRPSERLERVTTAPEGAPNVIFLVVDTLRWNVFREVVDSTPEGADFLAAFGPAVHFERTIAVAPWTAPSVASIFTGVYPNAHGYGAKTGEANRPLRRLDPSVPTLAQVLRNRGYRTYAWVTNPILYPATGISRGFDSYELLQAATIKLPLLKALRQLDLVPMDLYQPADALRKRLEGGLDQLEASEPFLLWLHAMDPHSPLHQRPKLQPETDSQGRVLDEMESMYYGEVRFALAELAKMIRLLKERGLWDDSLRVFVADHGEMFPADGHRTGTKTKEGEPKIYGHGHALYDELVRVPLLVSPPGGLERAFEVHSLTSHVDLYATVADELQHAAGLELPPLEGERYSLARWWRGDGSPSREAAVSGFLQHRPKQRALVGDRLKIIDFIGQHVEVYDLEADPREQRDLSAEQPEAVTQGMVLLERYWQALGTVESGDAGVEIDEETRRKLEALGYL